MADDPLTTAPGGGSENKNAPSQTRPEQTAPPDSAVEEAHIIEETIVKPAPSQIQKEPALSKTPPLAPSTAPAPTLSAIPSAPFAAAPISGSVPASTPSREPLTQTQGLPKTEQPLKEQMLEPIPPHTPEEAAKEHDAISNALKSIKLPERRPMPGNEPPQQGHVFDTALGAGAEKPQPAQPAPLPQEPTPQKTSAPTNGQPPSVPEAQGGADSVVTPLRTLKNDLQDIVREKKISLVRAAALESDKKRIPGDSIERAQISAARSRKVVHILFAVFMLVLLGSAATFGVVIVMQERSGIPPREAGNAILFSENTYAIPLENHSPLETKRLIAQARNTSGTLGSITQFVPVETTTTEDGVEVTTEISLGYFLERLGAQVPEDLKRALSQEFFFGFHTVDENAPIFVIPVASYERAFAGMLNWEQTMNADLSPIFTAVPEQKIGLGGLPEKRRFEDVVMRNYDVRVLKNDAGVVELYYSFPNQHLLIIGESVYSFTEVLNRLRAERKL